MAERIYNLELREDDIWVVSYPKTCTVLYCTVLHCTVLYCIVLYCTALHPPVLRPSLARQLTLPSHRSCRLMQYRPLPHRCTAPALQWTNQSPVL